MWVCLKRGGMVSGWARNLLGLDECLGTTHSTWQRPGRDRCTLEKAGHNSSSCCTEAKGAIASRLEAIAYRVEVISTWLEAISTWLEAISTWLEAIASRLEAIAYRVEAISTWLEAISTWLEAISTWLEAIARLEANATRLEANATRLEAVATRLEANATRLEAIATRLEAVATRLEAIATRLEAIATRFEAIATRLESTSVLKPAVRSAHGLISFPQFPLECPKRLNAELLPVATCSRQLTNPVLWEDSMKAIIREGVKEPLGNLRIPSMKLHFFCVRTDTFQAT